MTSMGRNRGGRWSDRPANVEIDTQGDVTYFRYVFPDGQRRPIGNSRDKARAYAAADALNGHFAKQQVDISTLVEPRKLAATPKNPLIVTLIEEFRKHDPARKKYAARTREEQDYRLNHYGATWSTKTVRDIQTIDVSTELNKLSDNAYVKHRGDLWRLFQFAGHQGYITINPVAVTLVKHESTKVRQRHTWEGYKAILDAAPPWLQRAMRIALYSLQRRDDVVRLHKVENKVDLERGTITILQRKTRNYKVPVWIEIEMGTELRKAVDDCLRSEILCPFLVHRKPLKTPKRKKQTKAHPFAVTPSYLSKAFRKVRDKVKAYADLPEEERPTFHELRALGIHLYEQAGYAEEYVMALSGHAKKETYERYRKDFEEAKPKRVSAGITVAQLPK